MKKQFFYSAALTLLTAFAVFSCSEDKINPEAMGHIKGQVVDDVTDTGITDAQLTTNPATKTYLTNDSGFFTISDIDIGEYTLAIKKAGYRSESITLKVAEEDTTNITVIMNRNSEFNKPPQISNNPTPATGATNQPIDVTLSWGSSDANFDDTLSYRLVIFKSGDPEEKTVFENLSDTTLLVEDLEYNTTYYWQVAVSDGNITINSEIWSFKTTFFPDNPFIFAKRINDSYEIFSGDSIIENSIQLTVNNQHDWYPKVDPFGHTIAYASLSDFEPHIYTMNVYGEETKKITTVPVSGYFNNGMGFCWSSNGSYLFYPHNDLLYRVNKDGSGTAQIAVAPKDRNFRIINSSRSGQYLVAQTMGSKIYESEIYLMKTNGRDTVRLVDDLPGIIDYPSFSIDDKKVLFTHDISGHESIDGRQLNTHIFTIDIETKEMTDISIEKPEGTLDIQPSYSPDGSKIIFVNTSNTGGAIKNIWIMDTNGKNRTPLIPEAEMPQWK